MTQMVPAWIDGVLTPVEKLEVHRRGLRHPAISVFVMAGQKTLIQRRALGKYHTPGLWANSCCTHPRWGEDAAICAARRLGEELGITGLPLRPAGQIEYRAPVGPVLIEHEVVDLFVAQTHEDHPLAPDPAEVMDAAWISLADLSDQVRLTPERFTPWLRIYLEQGWVGARQSLVARDGGDTGQRTPD